MRRLPIILAITILLTGCSGGADTLGTIAEWVDALHAADFARLATVDGAAPSADQEHPRFEAWRAEVAGVLASYESQRDLGEIEIDPRGYMVPLATRMGRGTYWELVGATPTGESIQVRLKLNFGYGEVAYGNLPKGTTVYLLTAPLGSMKPIVLGRGRAHEMEVLEHVDVGVELTRAGDGGLRVDRVWWNDDTAVFRDVSWVF